MEAYCDKQGKQMSGIRFMFDGKRIRADQTAEELGLENEDSIDAMLEQQGGFYL
jgi:small ubiquitin-related modifier